MVNQVTNAENADPAYKSLYKLGGVAALIVAVLILSRGDWSRFLPATQHGKWLVHAVPEQQHHWTSGLLGVGSSDVCYVHYSISRPLCCAQES